jgi:hypothetical protein
MHQLSIIPFLHNPEHAMAAATPEMSGLASVHIRILESLTRALSKAISSEYESLAQKRESIKASPKVEVVAQVKMGVKPPKVEPEEVELQEISPQEARLVFHQLFEGLPVVQPLHEELEDEEEEEFIPRSGLKPEGNFRFDSSQAPPKTKTYPVVEIPSGFLPRNTAMKSKRTKPTSSGPQQSPRKETRIPPPQKTNVTTSSTIFQRNASGQIIERNASGQFIASENKYEKSYETTEGSDSQEDYIPAVAKKRKVSPASRPSKKQPSRNETESSSDVPLSSIHKKSSTDDGKFRSSEASPLTRPTKAIPKPDTEMLSNGVSVSIAQTPVLQRIGKMVEERGLPENNSRVFWENFKAPTPTPTPTPTPDNFLNIDKETEKNTIRFNVDKRQMYETTRSKDMEESRDFYPATDEEIAAARIHCRNLVHNVWREEAPKKEKIWGRVWTKYGDESMFSTSNFFCVCY